MINRLFYRRLYGEPSTERTRSEIDCLEGYLSDHNPVNEGGFGVGVEEGHTKYLLDNSALVRLVVLGNFSIVTVEAEKNHRKLFRKLREVYIEVRVKSLE